MTELSQLGWPMDWAMAATSRLMLLQDDERVAALLHRAYRLGVVHALEEEGWNAISARAKAAELDKRHFYLEKEMP